MPPDRLSESLRVLRDQIDERWPTRSKRSDGWIGDPAHQRRESQHNPDADGTVDAIDVTHDPDSGCDVFKIAEAIRKSQDRRVGVVIFNRQIYSSRKRPWQWRVYGGDHPHTTHMHIDVLDAHQDDRTPWQIGDGEAVLSKFDERSPDIMNKIMDQLGLSELDAAAIVGNAGHESDGFKAHFQYNGGSARGLWQWDGSRRSRFEQKVREWRPTDRDYIFTDEANIRYLVYELTSTSEKGVLPRMAVVGSLPDKTKVFCDVFERPGVKAYDSRINYARKALQAFNSKHEHMPPVPTPPVPTPAPPIPDDGNITPDNLLKDVRPEKVVVRDEIISQIEGFPKGVIETTYVRQSCRFVPQDPRETLGIKEDEKESKDMNSTVGIPTLPGKKTYIVAAIYAAAMFSTNVLGMDVPGFTPDPDWLDKILVYSGLGSSLRAAIGKVIDRIGGKK